MMKRMRKVSLVVCVLCLVSLPAAWAAQRLTTQAAPSQSPTPGLTSGVVSVAPGSLSRTSSAGVQTRTPVMLPAQKKYALINDIRVQAGKQRLEVPPSIDEVILTPSQPNVGNSWLGCQEGTLCAAPPHGSIALVDWKGSIDMEFNLPLRRGSFYLVDCTVNSFGRNFAIIENGEWLVDGTQRNNIFEEDGHLCFAFRASSPSAHFVIKPLHARMGRLYRVELTRVP